MKTIVLLALISLSFALIPKELFTRRHFETTNNVTSDSFNNTQSNNFLSSSDNDTFVDDYGYFYSDESDWSYNVTNSTDSIWNDNNTTNSTFIPLNETDADIDNNIYFMIALPLAGSLKNLTEELNTYLQSDETDFDQEVLYKEMLESLASLFNETIEENSSYDDILVSIASLFNETIEEEALYGLNELFNITNKNDNDSVNTQLKNFRAVVLEVCLLPYNESGQIDIERYIVVAPESDESDWNDNMTNSTNNTWTDNVGTFILLNETDSVFENEFDSESTKPLRPTFKSFTEELKNYFLSNETNAEAESLYDEMVEAIALLVNETLGEKGLYEFEQGENLFGL